MRKLIVAVLLFCGTALFAQTVDFEFFALIRWAEMLANDAKSWNTRCADQQYSAECELSKGILNREYAQFISVAKNYKPVEMKSCLDALRPVFVRHQITDAQWNIDCAGRDALDSGCLERSKAIDEDNEKIQAAIKKCASRENNASDGKDAKDVKEGFKEVQLPPENRLTETPPPLKLPVPPPFTFPPVAPVSPE